LWFFISLFCDYVDDLLLLDANMWKSIMWAKICIYRIEGAKLSLNISSCHW